MNDYTKSKKKKLIIAISLICLILLLSIIMIVKNVFESQKDLIKESVLGNANLSIGKVHQTHIKDGVKLWVLDADTGDYYKDTNQVIMTKVSLLYYLKPDKPVLLTADSGKLDSGSYDMIISGNVVITSEDKKIISEELMYHHKTRTITSEKRVSMTGTDSELSADTMVFNLNTEGIELNGNVEGNFIENSNQ